MFTMTYYGKPMRVKLCTQPKPSLPKNWKKKMKKLTLDLKTSNHHICNKLNAQKKVNAITGT